MEGLLHMGPTSFILSEAVYQLGCFCLLFDAFLNMICMIQYIELIIVVNLSGKLILQLSIKS